MFGRYRNLRIEVDVRCKICEDIEDYITAQTETLESDKKALLADDVPVAMRDFLEGEVRETEMRVKVARRVIDEIIGNHERGKL